MAVYKAAQANTPKSGGVKGPAHQGLAAHRCPAHRRRRQTGAHRVGGLTASSKRRTHRLSRFESASAAATTATAIAAATTATAATAAAAASTVRDRARLHNAKKEVTQRSPA
jgi:hypothetical protein